MVLIADLSQRVLPFEVMWDAVRLVKLREAPRGSPFLLGARVELLTSRWVGEDACLVQALATIALLRYYGHRGDLVLGVKVSPFRAHAWVELEGVCVVGGRERPGFVPLWRGKG